MPDLLLRPRHDAGQEPGNLKGFPQAGPFGFWTGLAPDGSLLSVRDASIQEIHALDWEAP